MPLSEEHCWSSMRKKKTQNTNSVEAGEIKTISKNNSRCVNLNRE
jgi:hypothetical protein